MVIIFSYQIRTLSVQYLIMVFSVKKKSKSIILKYGVLLIFAPPQRKRVKILVNEKINK